jgi:carbon storage regulator
MLVLTRKIGEEIAVGKDVTIRVLQIHGNRVRVGIVAPSTLPIHRGEVQSRIVLECQAASLGVDVPVPNAQP